MRPYIQELLLDLPAHFPDWQFKFFTPAWNEAFEVRHQNVEVVVCRSAPRNRVCRVIYEQTLLPRIIAQNGVDVWLGTCNYLPLAIRAKTLVIVQSHQFFTNPESFGFVRRAWLPWIVRQSVRRADRVAVQCADAGRTLLRYVDISPGRLKVVYNRLVRRDVVSRDMVSRDMVSRDMVSRDAETETAALTGGQPYLLYVSGFYPFKNHARLIEAFEMAKGIAPGVKLVLVGGGTTHLRGPSPDVIVTGRVPDWTIPGLYRNAIASVFPSLEETFGLPVLEAMSMGCPVLTSNRSSMSEIAGDAALLVDPTSVNSIAEGIRRILLDTGLRARLIERGRERCRLFTRDQTIAGVADALRQVAALAYNTVGGSSLNHGSAGYTGTGVHFHPGPPSVRSEEVT